MVTGGSGGLAGYTGVNVFTGTSATSFPSSYSLVKVN
jgi:hypothetical protein